MDDPIPQTEPSDDAIKTVMVKAHDDGEPGRDAHAPWQMPRAAWWQVAKRVWDEVNKDNIALVAAGVSFYTFLSIVPLLGSTVLIYGIVADPATIQQLVQDLFELLPTDVASIMSGQLVDMVRTAGTTKGWALLLAIATALYGAMRAASGVIMAMNVANEERETRGFVWLNVVTLLFTIALVGGGLSLLVLSALGVAMETLMAGYGPVAVIAARALIWVLIAVSLNLGVAIIYRYAPDRAPARWRWVSAGSLLTTFGGLILTIGFSLYVANFGSYNATYGALGAVVVFLLWLYLLAYLLCVGAELNAELEKQTAVDTTSGHHQRAGKRGAAVADMVAVEVPAEETGVQASSTTSQ